MPLGPRTGRSEPDAQADIRNGILKGLYKFQPAEDPGDRPRVHLFGSGPLINEALRAQALLRDRYAVAADVWSVTSYNLLYRDALACARWNRLHPDREPRMPYVQQALASESWPIVATSDYVSSLAERLCPWTPTGMCTLSADGFGRSDARAALRRHFETDAEHITLGALTELARVGKFDRAKLPQTVQDLGIDPDASDPACT